MKLSISELMKRSGVAFGTSGARGLATAMTDLVCYAYTRGFLQFLESIGELRRGGEAVVIGGDFRPSTDRIMAAVCRAVEDMGYRPLNCGKVPSPAVALLGFERKCPSIMVTGSHIPDDRNGIKFNKVSGEVLKEDERGIAGQAVQSPNTLFDAAGWFRTSAKPPPVSKEAATAYLNRYLDFFGPDALRGLRVGVYQHSAVGRDLLVQILSGLGAETVALGRSDTFLPVDTEAIRPEDVALAQQWAAGGDLDAIVSADGDSDRPLVSDEQGQWLRGDVAGILCAKFLQADTVCTPVSCNTAVEKCGWFQRVRRTRIGSPYVVAAMMEAGAAGAQRVVGYEANGGFLLNSNISRHGRTLRALPTRDSAIVIVSILLLAKAEKRRISELVGTLPERYTFSDRLKNFPTEKSAAILAGFSGNSVAAERSAIEAVFGRLSGRVTGVDRTDGLRIVFENGEIIHLRPSGNAPEFRCYTEAGSPGRAGELNHQVLHILPGL